MGRFIPLTGVNPPSTRPKVNTLHPLLPESGGALMLIEPGAPGSLGWAPGMPANGAVMNKNIALQQALAAIPGSTEATLSPAVVRGNGNDTDGILRVVTERSAKGGLHTIFRPGNEDDTTKMSTANAMAFALASPSRGTVGSVAWWLDQHKSDHAFFWTTWFTATRIPVGATNAYDASMTSASNTAPSGNFLALLGRGSTQGADLGSKAAGAAVNVPDYVSVGTNNMNGDATKPIDRLDMFIAGHYSSNGLNSYTGGGSAPTKKLSRVTYLAYIEDLTVSGRTYAQVEAINAAAHAAAFGPGGRYAGDSWTNPNTWTP